MVPRAAAWRARLDRRRCDPRLHGPRVGLPHHHVHPHAAHRRLPPHRRLAQRRAASHGCSPASSSGELFSTIGISHLTTSRRHLGRPVLAAEETPTGFRLDGMSPWVTGAAAADVIVMAATLVENGAATDRELVLAVPTDLPGVSVDEPFPLVGLTASSTGPVRLDRRRSVA